MAGVRSLGQLTIDLLLKTGAFESGMERAERLTGKSAKKLQAEAKVAGAAIGTALAAGATAVGVAVKKSIDKMDDLSKSAQRVSMPTEEFSKLAYAGDLADVAMGDLVTTMGRLTKSQAESLDPTSEQAKVFKALGISVTDSTGKLRSGMSVLEDFADAFQRQKGSPEIMAAGMKVFGKSFQNIIPLIKDGSKGLRDAGDEAERFGQVISTEAGRQAEEFNDNLTRMQSIVTGVANAVAADLMPDMLELQEQFLGTSTQGDKMADTAHSIADGIRMIAGAAEFAYGYVKGFSDIIGGLSEMGTGLVYAADNALQGNWDLAKNGMKVAQDGADLAYYGRDEAERRARAAKGWTANFNDVAGSSTFTESDESKVRKMQAAAEEAKRLRDLAFGPDPKRGSGGKSAAEREADAAREAMRRYGDEAKLAAAALQGPYAEAQERARQEQAEWAEAVRKGHMAQADFDTLLKKSEADLAAYGAELEKQQGAPQALLDTMTGEVRLLGMAGEARERYSRELQNERDMRDAINTANQAGAGITAEQTEQYVEQARAIADWSIEVEKAAENMQAWEDIAFGALDGVGDAFGDLVRSGMRDWEDFGDSLVDITKNFLGDIAQEFVNQQYLQPMKQGINNWLSSFMGGNGFAAGGQSGGNLAQAIGGGQGGSNPWMSALGSWASGLAGGGTTTAAYGLSNVAPFASSMYGGSATAALGTASAPAGAAAGGAAGALGAVGSFMPWAALIVAGMKMADKAYGEGFGLQYQNKGDMLKRGFVSTGGLATPLMLDSMSLDKIGKLLGMSDKTAAIFSGSSLIGKVFGRSAPKITGEGISGTYGFGGLDGQSFADIKQKGGWFRSDKKWTQYGAINGDIDKAFDSAAHSVKVGATSLAKQLGIDVSSELSRVKVNIGKMQLDKDSEIAQQQLEKAVTDMMENLSASAIKALGFSKLLDDGFAATDTMTALSSVLELVNGNAAKATLGMEYFQRQANELGTDLATQAERIGGILGDYGSLMADVQGELLTGGLSDAQKAALEIETTYRNQVKQANDLAKALGLSGASSEDLAKIEQLRAVNMGKLQQQMEAQRSGILDGLALSEYSPSTDAQKLQESMQQLRDAAAAGDSSAVSSLASTALGFGRNLYASGNDYNALYGQVTSIVDSLGVPSLVGEDGINMGDLADILLGLPDKFAAALFERAYTPAPASTTSAAGTTADTDRQLRNIADKLDVLISTGKISASDARLARLELSMNSR